MEVLPEEPTVIAFRFIEIVNNKGLAIAVHSSPESECQPSSWGGDSRIEREPSGASTVLLLTVAGTTSGLTRCLWPSGNYWARTGLRSERRRLPSEGVVCLGFLSQTPEVWPGLPGGPAGPDCYHSRPQRAYCGQCSERIWGLARQGYRCINCKLLVHKRCHVLVPLTCRRHMVSRGVGRASAPGMRRPVPVPPSLDAEYSPAQPSVCQTQGLSPQKGYRLIFILPE